MSVISQMYEFSWQTRHDKLLSVAKYSMAELLSQCVKKEIELYTLQVNRELYKKLWKISESNR